VARADDGDAQHACFLAIEGGSISESPGGVTIGANMKSISGSRPRRAAARAVIVLASCLLTLGLLEAAIRLCVPGNLWRQRDAAADWRPDPELGWVQRPDLDVTTRTEQGWLVRYRTNPDGIAPAGARRPKPPGTIRILLFGDSTVAGRGVPPDRAIHRDLERLLRRTGRRVEVLNAGVEGYSTDQELLLMRRLIPLYHPDLVAYGLCDNDFGGNESRQAYGLPKPRFTLAAGGELTYLPPAMGSPRPAAAAAGDSGGGPRQWIQRSALYRLLQPRIAVLRARFGSWRDRNLLGIAPDFYYAPERLDAIDWKLFTALLTAMDGAARSGGARFFFYAHPALAEVWDPYIRDTERRLGLPPGRYDRYALERRLRATAAGAGLPYCPLIDAFRASAARGPFHLLPRDPHCNPVGYEVTAEALARFLTSSGLLGSAPLKNAPTAAAAAPRRAPSA
jgi:lysophospholipase L1-like esterase